MPQEFRNARRVLDTTMGTIYTVPSGKTAVIVGCQVANVSGSTRSLTMSWVSGSNETHLAHEVPIPSEAAYEPIGGRLVLTAGMELNASSNANSSLEVTVSVLELD